MDEKNTFDLVVIGGGINGVGIARDAAGRGLSVALCEQGDLASATSSASSKLIHGGLRYLEHYAFGLVAEALSEREVLLNAAPHIITPATFVLPYSNQLRPAWMLRLGLLLYDTLGGRSMLHRSRSVDLRNSKFGSGLKPEFNKGFVYSDCTVDDARLVVLNALSAAQLGAQVLTRAKCVAARSQGQFWHITLEQNGVTTDLRSRALVNATGPWVNSMLSGILHHEETYRVRLVKGGHIVVPRLYEGNHAYILQNDDGRVVFIVPYLTDFTLIGTTDIPYSGNPADAAVSPEEIEYLCKAVNRYSPRSIASADVVWAYSGVRPLFDDGTANPSAVTRDYKLHPESEPGGALLLTVFGGKITTYRKLAEAAMEKLGQHFPHMKPAWTTNSPLPGGNMPGADFQKFLSGLLYDYRKLPQPLLRAMAHRHGTLTRSILGDAPQPQDLGESFGGLLYAREIDYFIDHEWAHTAEDILWRRTKAGLYLSQTEILAVQRYMTSRKGAFL